MFRNIFLSIFIGIFVSACGGNPIVSGTFEGTGEGKYGPVKVTVTLQDSKITTIDILESTETESLAEPVYTDMRQTVIDNNNINVDIVSGATVTSEAFLVAVTEALSLAKVNLKGKKIAITSSIIQEDVQNYDIVIIGAGGAGFSAAIEAKNNGASNVVILEKMATVGGSSLISGAQMNAANNWIQQKQGIKDSAELFYKDTLSGGDNLASPELVKYLTANSAESAEWMHKYIKVTYLPENLFQFGGHSVPRAIVPAKHTGEDMVNKFKNKAEELGIVIRTQTKALDLIVKDGRVVGVTAETSSGQKITFNADKAVIIASGGFGASVKMRKQYNKEYDEKYLYTVSSGNTGDGIVMAQKVNADLVGMEYIQTYPVSNPQTGVISLLADSRFYGAILINQEGQRFVEELDRRDVISKAILAQSGGYAYQMWNEHIGNIGGTQKIHQKEYETLLKQGLIVKADTLEDAAAFFKIPVENLKTTIDQVNQYAKSGKDLDFNHRAGLVAFTEGPYYIQKSVPSVHHTMGGLKIDKDAHVLDINGVIIPGLYAAGEVTGGIHGSNRLGGNAITDIVVFGRTAGRNAIKGI